MLTKPAIGYVVALMLSASTGALAATVEVTPGIGSRMLLHVWSLRELKVRSVIIQKYDYSCGSAALATLLTYHYGNAITEEVAFRAMFESGNQQKIQQEGFSLLDMKRFLEAQGYLADGFEVSLDDLSNAGIPAIVLIVDNGYHHFVVIKGMRDNKVLLGDPAVGLRVMPREQFEASWPNRIVFVIHDSLTRGEFNAARDWSVRPRAPLGQPLSADTLSSIILLRPGGGDF
ncbi:C39 family peptidase [Nitrospira sp. NS4]|uniref:C39 family peptidase n=1 Tax=Nitrospira sp. NS4 TaxID=3414498 RepID=UPI003C2F1BE1